MTLSLNDFELLCDPTVMEAIDKNIDRDPIAIALDRTIQHPQLVASQVKYLQRSRHKLPSYYAARCIIPSRAYEQSSSEECSRSKALSGSSILDLTCGLGVDSLHFSHHFDRVVALERDPMLALITRENFRRMGVTNVDVECASAEDYLATSPEGFDWIYADPDRRSEDGRKLVRLEECSPNVVALADDIQQFSDSFCLKNSPLFDVDEAFNIFGNCKVEVVSIGDECKEVVVYTNVPEPQLCATAIGVGEFSLTRKTIDNAPCIQPFEPEQYKYLLIADVALQKSRMACHYTRTHGDMWSNNGYGFATTAPTDYMGKVLEIDHIEPFNPKSLRRTLKGIGVEILKRDMAIPTSQLTRQLALKSGSEQRIALTTIEGKNWTIFLKKGTKQ